MASGIPQALRAAVHERSGGMCEAMIPAAGCLFRAEHVHHRQLRSQGGEHTEDNVIDICHACHGFIHVHTGWSYDRGLLVRGWETPCFPPKYFRGMCEGKRDY